MTAIVRGVRICQNQFTLHFLYKIIFSHKKLSLVTFKLRKMERCIKRFCYLGDTLDGDCDVDLAIMIK